MERIKQALEEARERALVGQTPAPFQSDGPAALAQRIRALSPISELPVASQDAVVAAGNVLSFEAGAGILNAGDKDDCLHYLLQGELSLLNEHEPARSLQGDQPAARLPIDQAGVKRHTVIAVSPSWIFRIGRPQLERLAPVLPEGPLPVEAYADTYSGQELAALVGAIQADHEALIPEAGQADTPPAVREEVRFGETTLGVELPPTLPEVETLGAGPETPIPVTGPATISPPSIEDELSLFMRELDARFGRYVQAVRAQERTRYEVLLQTHAARLQKLAEQQLRSKLETIRARYQAAHEDKARRLRERYEHLIALTHKVTRQKAAIYQARRELEDKLRLANRVHQELAQLGRNVTRQLDELEGVIPDEE